MGLEPSGPQGVPEDPFLRIFNRIQRGEGDFSDLQSLINDPRQDAISDSIFNANVDVGDFFRGGTGLENVPDPFAREGMANELLAKRLQNQLLLLALQATLGGSGGSPGGEE